MPDPSSRRLLLPSIRRWGAVFGIASLLSSLYVPSLAIAAGVGPAGSVRTAGSDDDSDRGDGAEKRCKRGYAPKIVKKKVRVKKGKKKVWVTKEVTICVRDTIRPTKVTNLTAAPGDATVELNWDESKDNVGVVGYQITRSGKRLPTVQTTSFNDSELVNGTTYTYKIIALDAAGNRSKPALVEATPTSDGTTVDTQAPTAPSNLVANPGDGSVSLVWTASTDDTAVVGYVVSRDGTQLPGPVLTTGFDDSGLVNDTTYEYSVVALDAAGNVSDPATVSATPTAGQPPVDPPAGDTSPPSTPSGLQATASSNSVSLSWNDDSTDDVGVMGYNVYRATTGTAYAPIGSAPAGLYTDSSLQPGTYYYKVAAFDAAGNESVKTAAAQATVVAAPVSDTTPPTVSCTTPTSPTNAASMSYTCTFSESVTGFAAGYLSSGIGTTSTGCSFAVSGSGAVYTVTATGCGSGTVALTIASGAVSDAASNPGPTSAYTAATVTVDKTPPVAPSMTSATPSGSQVALSWSAPTGATSYKVYRDTSATGAFSTLVASPTSASYTNTGLASGTYYYKVSALDALGNESAMSGAMSATVTAPVSDTTPPTVSCTTPASPTNAASLSYACTFSELVTGFAAADVSNAGTATGCLFAVTGSGASYTVAASSCGSGTVIMRVAASAASDAANNPGPTSLYNAATVTVDKTAPTVSCTAPASASNLSYACTFSESVTGFAAADVSNTGTSTGCSFAVTGSGTGYTVTATGCSAGTLIPRIALNSVSDGATNLGPAAAYTAPSFTVPTAPDATAPSTPAWETVPYPLQVGGVTCTTLSPCKVSSLHALQLYWVASTDNVGVKQYNIWRYVSPCWNNTSFPCPVPTQGQYTKYTTVTAPTRQYLDDAKTNDTVASTNNPNQAKYWYYITAEDAAGNISAASPVISTFVS